MHVHEQLLPDRKKVLKKIPFEFAQTVQGLSPRVRGPASAAGGGDQGVAGLVQRRQAIRFQVDFSSMVNTTIVARELFRPAWEFGGDANPPRGEEDPVGASAGGPSPVLRHLTTFRGVLAGDLTLEREDEIFVPGSSAGSTDQLRNICLVSESVKKICLSGIMQVAAVRIFIKGHASWPGMPEPVPYVRDHDDPALAIRRILQLSESVPRSGYNDRVKLNI